MAGVSSTGEATSALISPAGAMPGAAAVNVQATQEISSAGKQH